MFKLKNILILVGKNAIISLIVVSISIFSIIYVSKEIEKITNNLELKNKLAIELIKRNESIKILKHDTQLILNNDLIIENAFIPSNNILEFINKMDNLAINNKISQTYRFETPNTSNFSNPFQIETISYSNNFSSNIKTFSNYLKEFEKLPYFTGIESFTISSSDKLGWMGTSNVSFRATLYTKKIQ